MAFKIKESFQIGSKTVLDTNANLSVLNAVIQSAAGRDTIELLGNTHTSAYKVSVTSANLTANRTLTLPDKTGTLALIEDITSGASFVDPIVDNLLASSATVDADLWSEITTGSITIGSGLTTGSLNIASSGTGATSVTLGHTNANIGITGNITLTGGTTLTSTLAVTGVTTLIGALNANGGISVDGTAFTVADTTGNVSTTGTLSAIGDFKVNTDKFVVTASSGNTSVGGTLSVTGITTLTGALNANGGISVDSTAFTVADTTGNVSTTGTLSVTGITTLTGALNANGGISVDSTAFTVADTTGNVYTAGTLSATGDFKVNTDKFVVTASSGNTSVGGTLSVTGITTLTGALNANGGISVDSTAFTVADTTGNVYTAGTLSATGDFKVNTDKFVVTASSGNTAIAGDLSVAGNLTISGTTTTVNTETILLSDNIITLNSNYIGDSPTENGGIEVERGTVDNSFLRWNETGDYWELGIGASATGRILTTADEGSGNNLDADTLDGQQGSYYLNYQNFTNVPPSAPGYGIISISADSGFTWGTTNTNVNQESEIYGDTLTIVHGGGINLYTSTIAGTDAIKIEHADTSAVSNLSSDNSANTFVQDISFTFDTYGHVTAASVNTADVTIGNGTLSLGVSGNGLSGSQSFTANQSGNSTFTVTSNATAASTASTIVFRDVNKDFAANIVTVEGVNRNSTIYDRYATATVATTNSTSIDTWPKDTYRSCKYIVQITQGANYQVSELLVIHNGTAASTTEYAVVETNGTLGSLNVSVDVTNVSLNVVMANATSASIKMDKTLITI